MKLQSASGRLETSKGGIRLVSRKTKHQSPVLRYSIQLLSLFKFSTPLPLSLSVGLAPPSRCFLFLSTALPSLFPERVTNVCQPELQLSRWRRGGGVGATQVRACALLWETASISPLPSCSAVPALQIQCSHFFFQRLLLSFVPHFSNRRGNSTCK